MGFPRFIALWNRSQGRSTPPLHLRIARWLYDAWLRGDRRLLLMVFRDAGKSTLVGLFASWLLAGNPNLRLLIISAEHGLASRMSRNIRRIIESHLATRHLLPGRGGPWTVDQFTVRRTVEHRDPSVTARGLTGNVTGCRADIVICDDVEVPNTSDTVAKRAELRTRLAELNFVLVPGGLQLFVGTPHSYYTIYAEEPRCEIGEERCFLDGFTRLKIPLVLPDESIAWPERFTPAAIEELRRMAGPLGFRSQMLLEPTPVGSARLDPDRLDVYDLELTGVWSNGGSTLKLGDRPIATSACWWDPAYGRPGRGDRSAIAAVLVDCDGHYWLHALRYLTFDHRRLGEADEATQQVRQAIEFAVANLQTRLHVETNGIGRFLPSLLRREIVRAGQPLALVEHHSSRGKDERILAAFDPLIAAGHLHVHRSVLRSGLLEEMREWQPGLSCRDDGLDAVSGCILSQPARLSATGSIGRKLSGGFAGFRAVSDFAV